MAKINRRFGIEFEVGFDSVNFIRMLEKNNASFYEDEILESPESSETFESAEEALQNAGYRGWSAKDDGSITGFDIPIEFTSPPLIGNSGIQQVMDFIRFLKSNGAQVNESTGLHVHIEVPEVRASEKSKMFQLIVAALLEYKNLETVFDKVALKARTNNRYAKAVDDLDTIIAKYKLIIAGDVDKLESAVNVLANNRYTKINLRSLLKFGTIEFRLLHGTLNEKLVANWILALMTFIDHVVKKQEVFKDFFAEIAREAETISNPINNVLEQNIKSTLWPLIVDSLAVIRNNQIAFTELNEKEFNSYLSRVYASFSSISDNSSYLDFYLTFPYIIDQDKRIYINEEKFIYGSSGLYFELRQQLKKHFQTFEKFSLEPDEHSSNLSVKVSLLTPLFIEIISSKLKMSDEQRNRLQKLLNASKLSQRNVNLAAKQTERSPLQESKLK